jgi:phage-related protein
MKYKIGYYSEDVEKEVLSLPRALLMRYVHVTKLMIEFGGNLGMPHTKALGDGLFELRLKGLEGIARVFYCTMVGQRIVILHSFIKKTDKIPSRELGIAIKRKIEVLKNG